MTYIGDRKNMVNAKPEHGSLRERGVALIGVCGFLLVFLVFAGAMVTQLAIELNSVKTAGVSNKALAAADAGVHGMEEQIQANLARHLPPPTPIAFQYPEAGGAPAATGYNASIDSVIQAQGLNYYVITSVGTFNNDPEHMQRRVRAIVRENPISGFGSFTNYDINRFGKPVWYLPSEHFDGPVYSGGPMHISYAMPGPGVIPIFGSRVQTVNQPVWGPGTPNSADWASIIAGGSPSSFVIDSTPLSMPQPSSNVEVASWAWEGDANANFPGGVFPGPGAPSPEPTGLGVYINGKEASTSTDPADTSGLFIAANGANVTINSVAGPDAETFTITGPWSGAYLVQISYGNYTKTGLCDGSTTVTLAPAVGAPKSHTYTGTPCGEPGPGITNSGNGAVFVDGGITFGSNSTLEGQFSFVTPDYAAWSANNNITLLGNLQYYGPTGIGTGGAGFDKVALWGNNVTIRTPSTLGITIDASIIAGFPGESWRSGDFSNVYCNASNCGSRDQHTLTINGGLIENARGAVGEWVGSTHTGFTRVINFDSRFTTAPPPFNPTTGELTIIAWEDLGT